MPDAPVRGIGSQHKLESTICITSDDQAARTGRIGHRLPRRPVTVGRQLPGMPHVAGRSDAEHLEACVSVLADDEPDPSIARCGHGRPAAPVSTRHDLPVVPDLPGGANNEDFQVTICIYCSRQIHRGCSWVAERRPHGVLRVRLLHPRRRQRDPELPRLPARRQGRGGSCWTDQALPSGSLK